MIKGLMVDTIMVVSYNSVLKTVSGGPIEELILLEDILLLEGSRCVKDSN